MHRTIYQAIHCTPSSHQTPNSQIDSQPPSWLARRSPTASPYPHSAGENEQHVLHSDLYGTAFACVCCCMFFQLCSNGCDLLNDVAGVWNRSLLNCRIQVNALRHSFRGFDQDISSIGRSSFLWFNVRRCCAVPFASRRKERVLRTPPPGPL